MIKVFMHRLKGIHFARMKEKIHSSKYIFLLLLNKKMNDNLHSSSAFSLKELLKQHNLQSLIDTHANKV